jgi:hypothetical protein
MLPWQALICEMSGKIPRHFDDSGHPGRRRNRFVAGGLTVAAHILIFTVLLWPHTHRPPSRTVAPPPPIQVSLLDQSQPKPPAPPEPKMLAPAGSTIAKPVLTHPTAPIVTISHVPDTSDLLSASQLAGAASVGEGGGGGGGGCDLSRAVQQALRRDPMVRAAVEDAHRTGKAVMLWNGDWVRSGDQDGKGLSAVREAIMWEVAFSPAACRNMRMHGLVLLSLADGRTRFAVGAGEWRWSDLLGVRGAKREEE